MDRKKTKEGYPYQEVLDMVLDYRPEVKEVAQAVVEGLKKKVSTYGELISAIDDIDKYMSWHEPENKISRLVLSEAMEIAEKEQGESEIQI